MTEDDESPGYGADEYQEERDRWPKGEGPHARIKAYQDFLSTLGVDRDTAEHRAAFAVAWNAGLAAAGQVTLPRSVTDEPPRLSEERNTIRGWE